MEPSIYSKNCLHKVSIFGCYEGGLAEKIYSTVISKLKDFLN